ncbi:hypothetical protein FJT64_018122 [Amphibalanus amphitrite]|uniref:Uncharacterized protein n=1 Tax=Amphibalanus amphitrite TaxID=1232801 RepID=A0A6A4X0E8_AMPAM|nr:hypothetical protein FJT64_018122 [Amphibalanus amphitrite]
MHFCHLETESTKLQFRRFAPPNSPKTNRVFVPVLRFEPVTFVFQLLGLHHYGALVRQHELHGPLDDVQLLRLQGAALPGSQVDLCHHHSLPAGPDGGRVSGQLLRHPRQIQRRRV